MLIKETLLENSDLIKYYSDAGFLIHKVGTEEYYSEAIEMSTTLVEYEETNIPAEEEEEMEISETEVEDMRSALEILGVEP